MKYRRWCQMTEAQRSEAEHARPKWSEASFPAALWPITDDGHVSNGDFVRLDHEEIRN